MRIELLMTCGFLFWFASLAVVAFVFFVIGLTVDFLGGLWDPDVTEVDA